jgi:hypothetical protein
MYAMLVDHMAKKANFRMPKLTLLQLGIEFMLAKSFKNYS